MSDSIAFLSASETARRMAAGTLSAERLVEACLARITEREPTVGAWAHLVPDTVLATARRLDAERAAGSVRGPLHGLPVGVKDIIDTADLPTEYGSPIYVGNRPAADADCVARTRQAGGIVLGKTVTTEFAAQHPGKTRNPHNPEHTPGGSSSGSAAAVADGMCPLAFGTQTGGSVIRPASFCGIAGYKPTFGVHSTVGIKEYSRDLDTLGFYGRAVEDLALVAWALRGEPAPALDRFAGQAPTLGVFLPFAGELEAASRDAVIRAAERARSGGARVVEIAVPAAFEALRDDHTTVMQFSAGRAFARELEQQFELLSPYMKDLLPKARRIAKETYEAALARGAAYHRELPALFGECDALLTPSAKGEAPRGLGSTGDALYNRVWTFLGLPCVTLPGHVGPQGLPVGAQLVGRRGDDARVLAAARWLEPLVVA